MIESEAVCPAFIRQESGTNSEHWIPILRAPGRLEKHMELELEDLDYQRRAIAAVAGVLAGQVKNTFDNSNLFGIQANITDLTPEQIEANKHQIIAENGVPEDAAKLSPDPDICIEMETGTGKTLVYLRTAYELYKEYRLTKFIILVPSVAIKEGVLQSFEDFKKPLADRYGFTPACFEYDSGKLSRLKHFIEDTQPQIMVMTLQSITSDDRIINQAGQRVVNRLTRTKHFESAAFKAFWERLARKTDYTFAFDEAKVVERSIEALNKLVSGDYEAEVVLTRIKSIAAETIGSEEIGRETERLRAAFTPFDLVEELSENTSLSYPTALAIVGGIETFAAVAKNPPKFLAAACAAIREIELDEMLRTLSYHPTGETIPLSEFLEVIETFLPVEPTPQRGVYDGVAYGRAIECGFTKAAEGDNEVVCLLKLPKCYRISSPLGHFYAPDFGLVLKRAQPALRRRAGVLLCHRDQEHRQPRRRQGAHQFRAVEDQVRPQALRCAANRSQTRLPPLPRAGERLPRRLQRQGAHSLSAFPIENSYLSNHEPRPHHP